MSAYDTASRYPAERETGDTMAKLNEAARAALRDAGVSQAAWARANWYADGSWHGDACGCPDDRCIGFHHHETEDCGCLPVLLASYSKGEGFFAERKGGGDDD